jgi:hypothetical protein
MTLPPIRPIKSRSHCRDARAAGHRQRRRTDNDGSASYGRPPEWRKAVVDR